MYLKRRDVLGAKFAGIALLGLLVMLAGCFPPNTDYEFGFGTSMVTGTMDLGGDDPIASDAIVVVLKNHDTFIPLGRREEFSGAAHPEFTRSITHPTANVVPVARSGAFVVRMPTDVVSVDIMFIARDRLTRRVRFTRSAIIGRIKYRAVLPRMPDWRSHFYTFLEPQLQQFIVEERYRLPRAEQKVLGDWLDHQKQTLESSRPKR